LISTDNLLFARAVFSIVYLTFHPTMNVTTTEPLTDFQLAPLRTEALASIGPLVPDQVKMSKKEDLSQVACQCNSKHVTDY